MDQLPPPYECSVDVTGAADEKRSSLAAQPEGEVRESAPPPSYETTTNNPPQYSDDPPPSYDTLILGKVQKVRDESNGNADFAKRLFCVACCGTTCSIVFIAICIAFPLASLIIGSIYVHDCPRERYIPIFLIVSGVFGILRGFSSSIHTCIKKKKDNDEECEEKNKEANPFDGVVGCFLFAWGIAGSVWVYRIYKDYQSVDPEADDYCHETLYQYAFWSLTVGYIVCALGICCACSCGGLALFLARAANKQGEDCSA